MSANDLLPLRRFCRCPFCRHHWLAIRTLCVRCGGWRWFRHDLLCRSCSAIVEQQTGEAVVGKEEP